MDLVRSILIEMERLPMNGGWHNLEINGRTEEEVSYHVRLMDEAGLIEAEDLTSHDAIDWRPKRITYAGHEFLDAARSDTVWNKAKEKVLSTSGSLTLEGIKIALPSILKALITG